jgi:hypothetical protein
MMFWGLSSDKKLNELGDPTIFAMRDPEDNTTSFELAIEQEQ